MIQYVGPKSKGMPVANLNNIPMEVMIRATLQAKEGKRREEESKKQGVVK